MRVRSFFLLCVLGVNVSVTSVKSQATSSSEVVLNVTVYDKKDASIVEGLGVDDFKIYIGKTELKIKTVSQKDDPVSVGILVDLSKSMDVNSFRKLSAVDLAEKGLTEFVNQANPANEYFVLGFGEQLEIMLDNTQNSSDVLKTLERISETEFEKRTAFYDAVYHGIEKLSNGKFETRVLVVVTDGYDYGSEKRLKDIIRSLKENNVTVHVMSLFELQRLDPFSTAGLAITEELSGLTGGMNFMPEKKDHVDLAFSFLAKVLKRQYKITIDFKSVKKNREWHKLEVKLAGDRSNRDKVLRVRQGIFREKNN